VKNKFVTFSKVNVIMRTIFKLLTLTFIVFFSLFVSCGDKKNNTPKAIYTVSAITNKEYEIEGVDFPKAENPTLTLKRGETYKFIIKAYRHPFYIKTEKTPGKASTYDKGVTNNGATNDTELLFSVPMDAPDVLYYVCRYHKMMSGELKIID
jgi:plastocyanin